jgi:FAD/FMN-containing dehydrogenase
VASGLSVSACGTRRSSAGGAVKPFRITGSGVADVRPLAATQSAGSSAADWAALGKDLHGHLVRPGDAAYNTGKRLYDPRFDDLSPAGIAYCHGVADVQACLAFARKYKVPVAARSGGHSYAGWSSTTGLIVDVTPLNEVVVSGTAAAIGAGAHLIDVYAGLAAHGRTIPGGSCPTVGIAGLTLGGGIGVTGRAHGLTCDNLLAVEVVTASGAVLEASPSAHADLFWACQGGGGGNFGIVTKFTYRTWATQDVSYFFLRWPWAAAADVIRGWQAWAPHAPDALWSNMHVSAGAGVSGHSGPGPSIEAGGTYLGSLSGLDAQLGALYRAVGSHPSSTDVNQRSYLDVMMIMAGCDGETLPECRLPSQGPSGTFPRVPQYAKSDFFTRPLSNAGIATLLRGVEDMQSVRGASGGAGGIALDALGGAINRVKPNATAFVHRTALFDAQYTTNWSAGAAPAGSANQYNWLQSFWKSMRPYASGECYQNYIDPALTTWKTAYYGSNLTRLEQVKAAYDPARLFSFPQAI